MKILLEVWFGFGEIYMAYNTIERLRRKELKKYL